MAFFSSFLKAVFQPVTTVVSATTQIVSTTTAVVDSTVQTIAKAVEPIPVVGTVLAEASQQVDNATDLGDNVIQMAEQTVADSIVLSGATLDLNGDDFDFAVTDILQYQVGGTVEYALTDTATDAVTSVFDFG